MSSRTHGVFAGLAVLLFGALALSSLASDGTPSSREDPIAVITGPVPTYGSSAMGDVLDPPGLPGVPAPVQAVLYSRGKAEAVPLDQLADIPPEVAAVLAEYGATLRVPEAATLEAAGR